MLLIGDIAADSAVVLDGRPDTDMDGGEHCPFRNHCRTSRYSTPKRMNSEVLVMAESRAAASRIAITRIPVGIWSRYVSPLPIELSLITLPKAVAIAICAEGSAGTDAVVGLSRISSIEGNWETAAGKPQTPRSLPAQLCHPGAALRTRSFL